MQRLEVSSEVRPIHWSLGVKWLKTVRTATGIRQRDATDCLLAGKFLLASRQQYLFDICLLQYAQSLTPDDGQKDRPKHVECYSNKITLRYCWICLILL